MKKLTTSALIAILIITSSFTPTVTKPYTKLCWDINTMTWIVVQAVLVIR